jgi:flagella basal body P-ring formation protein FlgA
MLRQTDTTRSAAAHAIAARRATRGVAGLAAVLITLAVRPVYATPVWQDLAAVTTLVREHVERSVADPGGRLVVTVVPPDNRLRLTACANPVAETMEGQRLWGWTQIRVRCHGDSGWSLGVRTHVQVLVMALVTRRALPAGTVIEADDIRIAEVDLTTSPYPPVTERALVVGKLVRVGLSAGQTVVAGHLKLPVVVRNGAPVEVAATVGQVSVTGSGIAQQDGAVGDLIRVRVPGGRTLQAVVTGEGRVTVQAR